MPVQSQQSSLAAKMGGRLAAVNGECSGQPLDLGRQRLPGGIKEGVAKLQMAVWKVQDRDDGKIPKGELYFSGAAVCQYPVTHDGIKVEGRQTFFQIPLCDVPAKGMRKASTFKENFNKFRSLMQSFGVAPCMENGQTDPTGAKTEAYWQAAMKALTNPQRGKPVYVLFETRAWKAPKALNETDEDFNNREAIVIETWFGGASPEQIAKIGTHPGPAAGVNVVAEPPAWVEPPFGVVDPASIRQPASTAPTANGQHTTVVPGSSGGTSLEDEVAVLIEIAMDDTDPPSEEVETARARLEDLAWEAGWTSDDTNNPPAPFTNDWIGIGDMALNPKKAPVEVGATVDVGSKWMFTKRTKDGAKLKNNKGEELAAQEIEITSVDEATRTCAAKTTKDGKDVMDVRTRKPVEIKFEWLEPIK